MTIKSSGPLAITDIVTEFGGSAPYSLSNYYVGGPHVPVGITNPHGVPTSGAISYGNFYGAANRQNYALLDFGIATYQADIGVSLDYFNGDLTLTIGYGSNNYHASANAYQLIQLTNPAVATTWYEVVQFKLTAANVVHFGTYGSGTMLKAQPWFGNPCVANFYWANPINGYYPTGNATYGQNRWLVAAKWNGLPRGAGGQITMYCNAPQYYTGDTGTDMTDGSYWKRSTITPTNADGSYNFVATGGAYTWGYLASFTHRAGYTTYTITRTGVTRHGSRTSTTTTYYQANSSYTFNF